MSKNEGKMGKAFNIIPKIGRTIILVALAVFVAYVGLTITDNFRTQSKATKFGLQDMGISHTNCLCNSSSRQ